MIKKTITFTDFEGKVVSEEHWFHLYKNKLGKLMMSRKGGLENVLPALIEAAKQGDMEELYNLFTEVVTMTYGVRTDASHFRQDPEEVAKFVGSLAFDALWTELASNTKAVAEFIVGVMPAELMSSPEGKKAMKTLKEQPELAEALKTSGNQPEPAVQETAPPSHALTDKELEAMSADELRAHLRRLGPQELHAL